MVAPMPITQAAQVLHVGLLAVQYEATTKRSSRILTQPQSKRVHMPESKSRKKSTSQAKQKPVRIGPPRWIAPLMLTLFGVGLLWIIAYYIAPDAPFLSDLSYWNVVIGFVLIGCGFVVSTKWK